MENYKFLSNLYNGYKNNNNNIKMKLFLLKNVFWFFVLIH